MSESESGRRRSECGWTGPRASHDGRGQRPVCETDCPEEVGKGSRTRETVENGDAVHCTRVSCNTEERRSVEKEAR